MSDYRKRMIDIVENVGKGHLGTSLSSLDIIFTIYDVMRPTDRFISSKGHDALAQYMALERRGDLTREQVESFRQPDGLPSHPEIDIPGIWVNTGSLGMGLSKALGFAIESKLHRNVFVLLGDGEMMEGQNYEAMLAISKWNVSNVIAVVDCNGFGQDGHSVLSPGDIVSMFQAARWNAYSLGPQHDIEDMRQALTAEAHEEKAPSAIIIPTIKGKGASNEGTWQSHAGPPRDDYSVKHPLYRKFGIIVERAMDSDPNIILCGADTLRDHNCYHLWDKYPTRVFDFGIAEQNMVSLASAMALERRKPIVVTYAAFLRRAFEQIYNQMTEGTKVVYVGSLAGPLESGGPGISHQSLDDGEYMGRWMNVTELSPNYPNDIEHVLFSALKSTETEYIRLLHHGA